MPVFGEYKVLQNHPKNLIGEDPELDYFMREI